MLPQGTIHQTDLDGREVIGVLVAQGTRTVWLDAADYDAVIREVGEATWFLGHNERGTAYVRVRNPDTGLKEAVARIITGRVRRTSVGYADGDRLNLRRKNLLMSCGCGGRPKRRRRLGLKTARKSYDPHKTIENIAFKLIVSSIPRFCLGTQERTTSFTQSNMDT